MEKLNSRRRVMSGDTPSRMRGAMPGCERALDVLWEAQQHWSAMDKFRRERERNRRYTYGDQWGDLITVDGKVMREDTYIREQGNVPLKNNLIRRLVRNVLGVYRSQSTEPVCTARDRDEQKLGETMSTILQCNMQLNHSTEMLARAFEEFLISGLVVQRKWYGWRGDKMDCWTDNVQPNNFIVDTNMQDIRGWDVSLVGELHDIGMGELLREFAVDAADASRLREIYHGCERERLVQSYRDWGYSADDYGFFVPTRAGRCRVIEVWRKESKPRWRCHDENTGEIFKVDERDKSLLVDAVNAERMARGVSAGMSEDDIPQVRAEWFMDDCWVYYYLSPMGDVLRSGETPYEHKGHPYVFKAYPYIDGEIHSFVSDVIDQQRYTNRLITEFDWIMRASAKGLLMVPEQIIEESHMTPQQFAEQWSKFNGMIVYKAKPGLPLPQQITANSTSIGITELLSYQLKFMEDISGVHGALQGRQGPSGTSGTLYSQQTQNAATSLLDLLNSFYIFVIDGAYKDVKNMQQFYDDKRVFNIAGRGGMVEYDPAKLRDVEFDLSITESTATPAYRDRGNELLLELWKSGAIPVNLLLRHGDFPGGDALLQSLESMQQEQEQAQAQAQARGVPPEVAAQSQGAGMAQ